MISARPETRWRLSSAVSPPGSEPHVALFNNLGGATPLEIAGLAEELFNSRIGGQIRGLVGPRAPWAWPGCLAVGPVAVQPLPDGLTPIQPMPPKNDDARASIERCCRIPIDAKAKLNALDAKSGDWDAGSTLATSKALTGAPDRMLLADLTQHHRAVGLELSRTMGASSGVLMATLFAAGWDVSASGEDALPVLKSGLESSRSVARLFEQLAMAAV